MPVRPSGLIVPSKLSYDEQLRLIASESPVIEGISKVAMPVIIVDNLADIGNTARNQVLAATQPTPINPDSASFTANYNNNTFTAKWQGPADTAFSLNNNTGIHTYVLHFVQGYKFRLDEFRSMFSTAGAPVGATAQIYSMGLYQGNPINSGGLPGAYSVQTLWSAGNMAAPAATTDYYTRHRKGLNGVAATGEVTDEGGIDATVRTLWCNQAIPDDFWVSGPGGIWFTLRTAVAAGGGLTNCNWKALLTLARP